MKKTLLLASMMFLAVGLMLTLDPGHAAAKKKPPPDPPAAVLDQVQENGNDSARILIAEEGAQSFVPGADGELTQVELNVIYLEGFIEDPQQVRGMTVEIHEAVDGPARVDGDGGNIVTTPVPSGIALASSFLPVDQLTPGADQWYTFSFSEPAYVYGGAQYAIVLTSTRIIPQVTETPDEYYWRFNSGSDAYLDGEKLLASINWNFEWSVSSVFEDFTFRTLMIFDTPADPVEICDDGIDNDGDNKVDCNDKKDCRTDPYCQ